MKLRTMFPVLGVVVALAGCSAETGQGSNVETASNAQTAANDTEARAARGPHHGPGGPDFLVFAALHERIDLTAEQRTTIEGLVKNRRHATPPAPDKSRVAALANAVRAGKVDASALQPNRVAMEEAMKAHVTDSAKALSTLHATLTKEQRAALVDAVASKAKGPRPEHHAKGERPEGAPHMGHHGGPPMHMLEGLDLTEAQRAEIKSKIEASRPKIDREEMKAKHEEMKKAMDAKLQGFKADTFDANAFVTPPEGAFPKAGMADAMANDLAIVVSVLNESQREKLAQKIEQGPPARPEGFRPGGRQRR